MNTHTWNSVFGIENILPVEPACTILWYLGTVNRADDLAENHRGCVVGGNLVVQKVFCQ